LDSGQDESYCPRNLVVQIGDHVTMLFDYASVKLDDPQGWIEMDLRNGEKPLQCFTLRLLIMSNNQNGKDSRVRAIRVFGLSIDDYYE
jgi:anaphase-promoting complex subunit 10